MVKKYADGKAQVFLLAAGKAQYGTLQIEAKEPQTKEGAGG